MEAIPYGSDADRRLDWVGFDACLMGSLENATLWQNYADWLVASEEVEPGDGWNYHFLSKLGRTDDPQRIGSAIIDAYETYYAAKASTLSHPEISLSLCDLSEVGAVEDALDAFLAGMSEAIEGGSYADVNRLRRSAKSFGLTSVTSRAEGYDLLDLCDLALQAEGLLPRESQALAKAVDDLVVDKGGNVEHAHGIALYLPGENRELYESYDGYRSLEDYAATDGTRKGETSPRDGAVPRDARLLSDTYDRFVTSYTAQWFAASEVDWSFAQVQTGDEGLSLKLTDEQAAALSSASYTVLQELDTGSYDVVTSEIALDVGGSGKLSVPANPWLVATRTDLSRLVPAWFNQVGSDDGGETYAANTIYLSPAADFMDPDVAVDDRVIVSLRMARGGEGERAVSVTSVTADDETIGAAGKSTVDVSDYASLLQVSYGGGAVHPTYDESGAILPWDEWETSGFRCWQVPLEQGFGFVALPASELLDEAWCQIVVTDVNGGRHALEPERLPFKRDASTAPRQVIVETEQGALTVAVYADHAEIERYEGDDRSLDLPTEVEGIPVTSIAGDAFLFQRQLEELVLPEGIEAVGASAFRYSGLRILSLPASLARFDPAAFAGMSYLVSFELAGEGAVVSVRDGVLFSSDGKTLLAYPNGKGTSYVVPEGTETIGYGAFANTDIEEVVLPEGLRAIDRAAFFDCGGLVSPTLPQSLERVGTLAFGSIYKQTSLAKVQLGPNVSEVGSRAFSGSALEAIEVDGANPSYASSDGVLLNAVGDALVEVPRGVQVTVVPEGVVSLGEGALADLPEGADIVLPESLTSIDERALPYSYETDEETGESLIRYVCQVHAPEGSYAFRFAEDRGIPCDSVSDRARLAYEELSVEQGDLTLRFRVYADHAVLTELGSTDGGSETHAVEVPAEVGDVPVTEIRLVDDAALSGYGIEKLELPACVERVDAASLRCLQRLANIEVSKENEHLKGVEGMLLSADGKTLVACAPAYRGASVVPDGVKAVGAGAFSSCAGLTSVDFPDSLKEIGDDAFLLCSGLEHVGFGRGLERIGHRAFRGCTSLVLEGPLPDRLERVGEYAFFNIGSYEGLVLPDKLQGVGSYAFARYGTNRTPELNTLAVPSLRIGQYLETVGDNAFLGLEVEGFDMDERNEHFRAEGPFLLTADGREVVAFASGYEGEATVPADVRTLDLGVFWAACRLTDLTIPESVVRLTGMSYGTDENSALTSVRVHVKAGSKAAQYAYAEGLPWIEE